MYVTREGAGDNEKCDNSDMEGRYRIKRMMSLIQIFSIFISPVIQCFLLSYLMGGFLFYLTSYLFTVNKHTGMYKFTTIVNQYAKYQATTKLIT